MGRVGDGESGRWGEWEMRRRGELGEGGCQQSTVNSQSVSGMMTNCQEVWFGIKKQIIILNIFLRSQ
jgi:hypothetical protein